MSKHLLLIFFILNTFLVNSSPIEKEELDQVNALFKVNKDSAFSLSYELIDECYSNDDYYGLVKLNYILGYYHKRNNNVGKSVLHYLEAIRYSKEADYEGLINDQIELRYNLGNIYRKYKANDLAISNYKEAIEIADWFDENNKRVLRLKFNLALTYEQAEQAFEAIALFNEIFQSSTESRKKRITNELGLIYWEIGELDNAKTQFHKLLGNSGEFKIYSAKALHNLGEIEYENGNPTKAIELILQAIRMKEEIEDVEQRSLFLSYKVLGDLQLKEQNLNEALAAYKVAETMVESVKHEAFSFEIYRSLTQLNYEFGNHNEAREHNQLYAKTVDNYLESQKSIQETDRQFNMDLITKRYLEEVDRQEQIASILLYSKTISGSLLALLLMTVGYNRYQKIKLRRSILEDLIRLKVVD